MLSYFLGLMYSEVVLAHLQLRFPFTSRMAERERERRWHLTGTDSADRDAAAPGAKGRSPCHVFTDSTAGTMVRRCHLCLYLGSLLPHCSQKLNPTPAKNGRAFSRQQGKPSLNRQEDTKLPSRSGRRMMPAKPPGAHLRGQSGTSPAAAAAATGAGGLPSSGKAQPHRCSAGSGSQTPLFMGEGHAPTQEQNSHLSSHTRLAEHGERGDVISQMLPQPAQKLNGQYY